MGHYEDFFYEIYETINQYGLNKEYNNQMQKMKSQDHHQYKDTRDRMKYACDKVVKLYGKKALK